MLRGGGINLGSRMSRMEVPGTSPAAAAAVEEVTASRLEGSVGWLWLGAIPVLIRLARSTVKNDQAD